MKKYILATISIFAWLCSSAYGEETGKYRYIVGRDDNGVSFHIPYPATGLDPGWAAGGNGVTFHSTMNPASGSGPVGLSFSMEDIYLSPATDFDGNESPAGHYDLYAPSLLALAPDGDIYFKSISGSLLNKAWQRPYVNTEKGWNGDLLLADWGADRNSGNKPYGICDLYLFLKDGNGQYSKVMNARSDMDCRADRGAYKDLLQYIEFFQTSGIRAVISERLKMADGNTRVTQISGGGSVSFIDPTADAPEQPYRFFKQTIEGPEGVFGGYSTAMRIKGAVKGKPVAYNCRLKISYQIRPEGSGDYLELLGLTMKSDGTIINLQPQRPSAFKRLEAAGRNWSGNLLYNAAYEKPGKKYGAIVFYVHVPSPLDVMFTFHFEKMSPSNLPVEKVFADFQVTGDTLEEIKALIKGIEVTGVRLDSETGQLIGSETE